MNTTRQENPLQSKGHEFRRLNISLLDVNPDLNFWLIAISSATVVGTLGITIAVIKSILNRDPDQKK